MPDAVGGDFVDAGARGGGSAADEGDAAPFQDFLEFAAFAKRAVKHWKDDVGLRVETREIIGRDVAGEDLVPRDAQAVNDGLAADQADFALVAGTAVENCDFHGSILGT